MKIFKSEEFGAVRTVMNVEDGELYFVAKDVATALGYKKPRNAISLHCKGALTKGILTEKGIQKLSIIPERDVYRLIFKSTLPSAEKFEEWVVNDVLPSIRKHNVYIGEEASEEDISGQALYGMRRIRKHFLEAEDKESWAEGCLSYYKKDTKNYVSAIKIMRDAIKKIDVSSLKPSQMLALRELSEELLEKKNKRENKSKGGELSYASKQIKELKKWKWEPSFVITLEGQSWFSINHKYSIENGRWVKSKRYNEWSRAFPSSKLREQTPSWFDPHKPFEVKLSGKAYKKRDLHNLQKVLFDRLSGYDAWGCNDRHITFSGIGSMESTESVYNETIIIEVRQEVDNA